MVKGECGRRNMSSVQKNILMVLKKREDDSDKHK